MFKIALMVLACFLQSLTIVSFSKENPGKPPISKFTPIFQSCCQTSFSNVRLDLDTLLDISNY